MKCPNCGSEDFVGGKMDYDEEFAWQVIECNNCGYAFYRVYQFVFFEDAETGKEIEMEE